MLNTDQILGAIEDLSFCAECHAELDKQKDFYSQCNTCDELLCRTRLWMCGSIPAISAGAATRFL